MIERMLTNPTSYMPKALSMVSHRYQLEPNTTLLYTQMLEEYNMLATGTYKPLRSSLMKKLYITETQYKRSLRILVELGLVQRVSKGCYGPSTFRVIQWQDLLKKGE